MIDNKIIIAIVVYFLGFTVAFGHSAADPCPIQSQVLIQDKCGGSGDAIMQGMFAGMVWPLYLSKKIFERVRN